MIDSREPPGEEAAARTVIGPWIDGALVYKDPPDFVIYRDAKVVGALEVTVAVPHEYPRMYGQIHKFGAPIESDVLEYTWQLWLDPVAANLRTWDRDRVVDLVRAVEQRGVKGHQELRDPLLKEELARLGISGMHRFLLEGVQKTFLAAKGWGGFVDGGAVDRLVAERIEVKSRQLRAMTGERHLFVWVSLGQWEAAAALNDEPPLDSPDLPDVVDTVWVAPLFGRLDSIWRRDRGSGWQVLAVADHHNPYKVRQAVRRAFRGSWRGLLAPGSPKLPGTWHTITRLANADSQWLAVQCPVVRQGRPLMA